jgi:DNA-binding transcriptional LysR family regulator
MIRHLPFFAIVAEEQHFQRAADRLRITQSALSRRIQLLEEELEVKLFERLSRGVRLTPAGESFYKDVRKVQYDLDQAKDRARGIMLGQHGRVDVAINPSGVNNPVVSRMFRLLRERRPEVQINTKMIYSEEQLGALHSNEIALGVLYQLTTQKGISYAPIDVDRLVLAMPAEHPLARKRALRLADLEEVSFIWPTRAHSPRLADRLIAACHARGFSPKIDVEVHSTESVVSIVAMGMAVGFITTNQMWQAPASVVVRSIEDLTVELPLCLAWRSDYASPILAHFISALEAAVHDIKTTNAEGQAAPAKSAGSPD